MMCTVQNAEIFAVLEGADISGPLPSEITGVACDSRQVKAGNVFVAINGTQKDGAQYICDAVSRGAVAVVSEDSIDAPDRTRIKVKDARLALARLSAEFYGNPSRKMFVAGITGTNGKTTTSYIMREMLRRAGRDTGLIGTVEYCMGSRIIPATRTTPEAPVLQEFLSRMVSAQCHAAVLEVSSHALEQKRVAGVEFDVGILTNLARDHLDYHKTRDGYGEAKTILFTQLSEHATAIVNTDDELGRSLAGMGLPCDVVTYGSDPKADFSISQVSPAFEGSRFSLSIRGVKYELETNLVGRFNVFNIVAALAGVEKAGIDLGQAMDCIAHLPTVPGRLEEVPNKKGFKVIVDYAHTDDALEKILDALRETTKGRLLLVFGCGGNRDRTKRPAMGAVAARMADFTVITSDNPRKENPLAILSEIEAGFSGSENYSVEVDRERAIRKALGMAEKGDVVVIAGKGHENFQEFENTAVSFDDRMVATKVLNG